MRIGLLAMLTVLLTGRGLALGEQYLEPVGRNSPPSTAARASVIEDKIPLPEVLPDRGLAGSNANAQAETFGLWGSAEYLLWWIKNSWVPPLVTAGGNGVLNSPNTRLLLDDLNFVDDFRQGGRFAVGYRFKSNPPVGVEAGFFFLSDGQADARFSSSGDPVLGRPYINAVTGLPAATLIASPGIAAGSATIGARSTLWGTEASLSTDVVRSDLLHLTALGGFRFLGLEDEVKIDEQFNVAPNVPGFGGNRVRLQDEFFAENSFYGGQLGLEVGVRFRMLTIDFRGKIGLGQMQQVVSINGATNVLRPDGSRTAFEGGLLALRSNIGRHQQDELVFIPEVGLNVGLQLTRHLKMYAGYSFLWVSTVARAGEQIDPVVNETQFPILSGNGPLVGPARPAFNFAETDFWAQGLNFGLQLRF